MTKAGPRDAPSQVCPARKVVFREERLHTALHRAAMWVEEHYFDGEPQAVTIEHLEGDAEKFSEWGGDWVVQVIHDV